MSFLNIYSLNIIDNLSNVAFLISVQGVQAQAFNIVILSLSDNLSPNLRIIDAAFCF